MALCTPVERDKISFLRSQRERCFWDSPSSVIRGNRAAPNADRQKPLPQAGLLPELGFVPARHAASLRLSLSVSISPVYEVIVKYFQIIWVEKSSVNSRERGMVLCCLQNEE